MAGDEPQLRVPPAHLIDALDLLRGQGEARTGHAGTYADRDIQLDARLVERDVPGIVDGPLIASRERRGCLDTGLVMKPAELCDPTHSGRRVGFRGAEQPVG